MDDSKFLPRDILNTPDFKTCVFEMERMVKDISGKMGRAFETGDVRAIKEFQTEAETKVKNLKLSLDMVPRQEVLGDPFDLVSNVTLHIKPLEQELDDLLMSKLNEQSLSLAGHRYILGLTKNIKDYLISEYSLVESQIEHAKQQGRFFLYDTKLKKVFIFNTDLVPVVFKYLVFNGKTTDLFHLIKRLEFYFTV